MQLEYFDDAHSTARPVLLIYGDDPNAAATLQRALELLVIGDTAHAVQIDTLPGLHGVDGCSLIARGASSNNGVTRISDTEPSFNCSLDPTTWSQVSGLLEPFTDNRTPDAPDVHQYLTSDGPIDWIVATSRHW